MRKHQYIARSLTMECLEERRLLAVFSVINTENAGFGSLRRAINAANATPGADTIRFASDLAGQTIDLTSGELEVTETLTIDATSLEQNVIVDAQKQSRVFWINDLLASRKSFDVTISGLTITGGYVNGHGGGIRFDSSGTLSLTSSRVTGNEVTGFLRHGGGIYSRYGSITLENTDVSVNRSDSGTGGGIDTFSGAVSITGSTIADNYSGRYGGGGISTAIGNITVTDSTVSGNNGFSGFGGGISTNNGSISVTNSTVSGNTSYLGGGISSSSGSITLTASTISGNSSAYGGGGILSGDGGDGILTITSSTISGNSSPYPGGGIYSRGSITIADSTISDNVSEADGGGIYMNDDASLIVARNSIVAGNSASNASDLRAANATTIDIQYSLIGDTVGSGIDSSTGTGNLLNLSPRLAELANNGGPTKTHALLPGSPAHNAGNPNVTPTAGASDQRGAPFRRVAGAAIDMGAFERQTVAQH